MAQRPTQQSVFLGDLAPEIAVEARRLDRSMSWVVQRAVKIAMREIKKFPSMPSDDKK